MKKILTIVALLCASVMGWAIDWSGYSYLVNGGVDASYNETYKAAVTPDLPSGSFINNMQTSGGYASIHIAMPSDLMTVSLAASAYTKSGAAIFPRLDAFTAQETEFTVTCLGTTYTFTIYNKNGTTSSATETSNLVRTSDASLTLDPGATSSITYTTGSTGNITYTSSNTSVATVDNSGLITAVASGEATITVEQEADDTYRAGSFSVTVSVNMGKKASGKGYGSLQMQNVDLYDWDGNFAGSTACGKVDLFVVTFGDKLIYKAVVKDGKTFENCTNYFCQLRTWKSDLTEMREQWALTCSDDLTTRYLLQSQTANAPGLISAYGDEIKLTSYMVVSGCGARTMKTVSYTRDYVNNYNSADVTAPVLGTPIVTTGTDDITITLPAVTSEEVFYMIEDAAHGKKFFSMQPTFVLAKDGSGITYNYSCYAIDYSGNVSAAQSADVTMPFSALINQALGKPCYSGANAGATYLPSKANDGSLDSRWSPGAVTNAEDAWWAIDLGADYSISSIDMLWEGAYSDNFIIYGATDKPSSWNAVFDYSVALVTNTAVPTVGNAEEKVNSYSVSGHARYLLFMPSHLANNDWGASFWEFRVYSTGIYVPGAGEDTEKPIISAASLNSKSHSSAVIDITATDNVGVIKVRVVDADNSLNVDVVPENNQIIVTGLAEQTAYNLTLKAYDAANNASDVFVLSSFTTDADPTIPQVAAPVPVGENKTVRPIYSDAFSSILAHDFDKDGFAGATLFATKSVTDNECLVYDVATTKYVTWGMYDNGGSAIIAADGYHSESYMGVDASEMEFMHLDIWSLQACNTILICINDQTYKTRLSHSGNGWQQFDLELSNFNVADDEAKRTDNVRWLKFDALNSITGKIALDNVYFWKYTSDFKSVSAQVNNSSMGTATAKVGDEDVTAVESGSEVTFTATPNDGYLFVNWTEGGSVVSTQATYVATVSAHTTLTANFRAIKTIYCTTPLEKDGHTVYVTMRRSAADTYQLIVRSDEELQNFGGTNFYRPVNTHVLNLRDQGELADGNHTLTVTMSAETEPYMVDPLYVIIKGVGEKAFSQLTDIEYAVACDESLAVTSVNISRTTASVAVGDEFDLTAAVVPAFAENKSITWSSDQTSVATVNSAGHVTALAVGTAHIIATSVDGGYTASCTVTVNEELETQTYWGNGTSMEVAIAYSITRNADHTLTYTIEALHSKAGFGVQVNDGIYHGATRGDDGIYRFTSETTYEEGEVVNGFFYMPYTGDAARVDFRYTVGSSSEQQAYIPITLDQNTDDASWIVANDGQTRDVEIGRPMTADTYFKTLCLPFSMSAEQIAETFGDCELLRLSEAHMKSEMDMYVGYERVNTIEAGYPYLITLFGSENLSKLDFSGVTINSSTENNTITVDAGNGKGVEMVGTFVSITRSANEDFYLDAEDNMLHSIGVYCSAYGVDALTIPAFRCYFRLTGFSNPSNVSARVIRTTEVATYLEQTAEGETSMRIEKLIRDGQLLIVRDGKVYTVTGMKIE